MVLECCISYKHAKEPELRPGKMIRIVGMREDLTTIILDLQGIMRLKMFVYWIYLRSGNLTYNYEVIKLWAHRYHEIWPSTVKIEKKIDCPLSKHLIAIPRQNHHLNKHPLNSWWWRKHKQINYHARKSQAYKNPIVTYVRCLKSVKHDQMVAK